jgi:hypothetical protein
MTAPSEQRRDCIRCLYRCGCRQSRAVVSSVSRDFSIGGLITSQADSIAKREAALNPSIVSGQACHKAPGSVRSDHVAIRWKDRQSSGAAVLSLWYHSGDTRRHITLSEGQEVRMATLPATMPYTAQRSQAGNLRGLDETSQEWRPF